jgi:hypothetical protein
MKETKKDLSNFLNFEFKKLKIVQGGTVINPPPPPPIKIGNKNDANR